MSVLHRIDQWIGRVLMHPLIIPICQFARISQHAFNRYLWWIVALHALWQDDHRRIAYTIFFILFALARTISAARDPDRETRSPIFLRIFFLGALAASLLMLPFGYRLDGTDLDTWLALIAEYATTIRTIPPSKIKAPKRKAAPQAG